MLIVIKCYLQYPIMLTEGKCVVDATLRNLHLWSSLCTQFTTVKKITTC